ncbi:MAG: 2OG-Fe(II) oxygenase family protein [Gammaproteobacteria bacterium]|nr:2OG-Fe(II) oxygenase family protein [Gammaproteobacteria bacterium]MDH5240932.1 2OG-Fe(II) oxygenase family protein [Gammaproteobacteria bacterium]MDH5583325.1 2OG-Fe(II) oxygenase family protein [Gammaproteobacteria bacterium]
MEQTPLQIFALFAAPVATRMLEDADALNHELETLLLARENEQYRNPHPTHMQQQEVFESNFDMFRWSEPCIQALRTFMMESILEVVADLNGHTPEDMAKLVVRNHTWFHVSRHGGSFVAHNHPMASWSAVYCVRGGEPVPERQDSGVLRFLDHRPGSNMFMDPANVKLRVPFNFGHYSMRLAPGQLVIFPSYLVHEVATFLGHDTRITVATNCWFTTRA